jgi:hypothetical protein
MHKLAILLMLLPAVGAAQLTPNSVTVTGQIVPIADRTY